MQKLFRGLPVFVLVAGLVTLVPPSSAFAAGVVGNGTSASCTESALDAALAGGGLVTFNCGTGDVTITVSSQKSITADTQIDGGDSVTISGGNSVGIFDVSADVTLTLQNLDLINGSADRGGAIYNDGGTVTVSGGALNGNSGNQDFGGAIYNTGDGAVTIGDATVNNNFTNGGGAIYNDTGTVTIADTTLNDNMGVGYSGALYNNDTMTVTGSTLSGNQGDMGGAVYQAAGDLTIDDSQLTDNGPLDLGSGGAMYIGGGTVTVTGSTLSGGFNVDGGAISNAGDLTIVTSTLSNNQAGLRGGAIYNSGTLSVTSSTLTGNSGQSDTSTGGGIYNSGGTVTITDTAFSGGFAGANGGGILNTGNGMTSVLASSFDGTSASHGGAIYNASGTVNVTASVMTSHIAAGSAGAVYNNGTMTISESTVELSSADLGAGIYQNGGDLTIDASTIYGNSPDSGNGGGLYVVAGQVDVTRSTFYDNGAADGGAIYNAGTVTVTGSTITDNFGVSGGGIYNASGATTTVTGSIVAGNTANGANCHQGGPITSGGTNLSDDDSCGFTATGDIEDSTAIELGAFGDNGGPTETLVPDTASDATGNADCDTTTPLGQRGSPRGFLIIEPCSIGSVVVGGMVPVQLQAVFDGAGPVAEGSPATIVSIATGEKGAQFAYDYDCDGGTNYTTDGTGTGTRGTGSCTYDNEGTYTVGALVCNAACDIGTTTVTVVNAAPTVATPTVTATTTTSAPTSLTAEALDISASTTPGSVEGMTVVASATFDDPGTFDTHTCTVDYGEGPRPGTVDGNVCTGPPHTYLDDHPLGHLVTVAVTDDAGARGHDTAVHPVHNAHPVIETILAPVDPVGVGETVTATLEFSDPGVLDTHSGEWDWGDGSTSPATIFQAAGSGTATGTHVYDTAGIYTLSVTLVDDDTGVAVTEHEHILVHDLDSGSLTAHGTLRSPPGAYPADPSLGGTVRVDLVARYLPSSETPQGDLSIRFGAADLVLRGTGFEWLVVVDDQAKVKGTATINGEPGYVFVLTATDAPRSDRSARDTLRIQIWEQTADGAMGAVVYDNQIGDAPPPAVRGSIVMRP